MLCLPHARILSGRFSIPGFGSTTGSSSNKDGEELAEEKTAAGLAVLADDQRGVDGAPVPPPPLGEAAGSTSAVAPPLAPA